MTTKCWKFQNFVSCKNYKKKKTGNDSIIQIYPLFSQVTAIKTHNSTKNVTFLFNYFHFSHTFLLQSCVSAGPEWLSRTCPCHSCYYSFLWDCARRAVKCDRNNFPIIFVKFGVFSKASHQKNIYIWCTELNYIGYIKCFIWVNYIWQTSLSTADIYHPTLQFLMYDLYIRLWTIFSNRLCQHRRISMLSDSLALQLYICYF